MEWALPDAMVLASAPAGTDIARRRGMDWFYDLLNVTAEVPAVKRPTQPRDGFRDEDRDDALQAPLALTKRRALPLAERVQPGGQGQVGGTQGGTQGGKPGPYLTQLSPLDMVNLLRSNLVHAPPVPRAIPSFRPKAEPLAVHCNVLLAKRMARNLLTAVQRREAHIAKLRTFVETTPQPWRALPVEWTDVLRLLAVEVVEALVSVSWVCVCVCACVCVCVEWTDVLRLLAVEVVETLSIDCCVRMRVVKHSIDYPEHLVPSTNTA